MTGETVVASAPISVAARAQSKSRKANDEAPPAEAEEAQGDDSIDGVEETVIGEVAGELVTDLNYPEPVLPVDRDDRSLARPDALTQYMREIQKHPLLSPEEELTLSKRYQESGDLGAAARMVTANLRLVVKLAFEYRRAYRNIMDLIQEGNIGLMQAVKRFDPYRGVKLSSYAAWWIRAYMLRFIMNNSRLVKVGTTQTQRKLFFNLNKERQRLAAMGIDPTSAEIARRLDVPEQEVIDMDRRLSGNELSLDAPVGDPEGRSVSRIDLLPSGDARVDDALGRFELDEIVRGRLATFASTLAGKEIVIFRERLVADEPVTLQEIGDRFGISRERVRQLEKRLQDKLRVFLKNELGEAIHSEL